MTKPKTPSGTRPPVSMTPKGKIRLIRGKVVRTRPSRLTRDRLTVPDLPPNPHLPSEQEYITVLAALTAALEAAGSTGWAALLEPGAEPDALTGCRWLDERASVPEVATLTGLAQTTIAEEWRRGRLYARSGMTAPGDFPLCGEDWRWPVREILTWQALHASRVLRRALHRWPARETYHQAARDAHDRGLSARAWAQESGGTVGRMLATQIYQDLGFTPPAPTDKDLMPIVRKLRGGGSAVRPADVVKAARAAGWAIDAPRATRLLTAAGGPILGAVTPDVTAGCGGLRGKECAGLIRAATAARAGGCTPQAITAAVASGRLTPWARDRWGLLFDLCRMKPGPSRAPVDKRAGGQEWAHAEGNAALAAAVAVLLASAGDRAVTVPEVAAYLKDTLGVDVPEKRAAVVLAKA